MINYLLIFASIDSVFEVGIVTTNCVNLSYLLNYNNFAHFKSGSFGSFGILF